ncbi:MAG: ribosome maturation factor RimP [Clostridiales bacterium]|jgi:ribosome maturation factor RimP|nr:ribosome maturation factor RimP [Clostridiales bacterium]
MSKKITDALSLIAEPVVSELGLELYDVEFLKEGANWFARVYIDKPGGVNVNDCEAASRRISELLDEKDPIPQSYVLEVSSPGIDRALKKDADFTRFKGETVDIKLYKPKNGEKTYSGALVGRVDGVVSIRSENNEILTFDKGEIAVCRLAVIF